MTTLPVYLFSYLLEPKYPNQCMLFRHWHYFENVEMRWTCSMNLRYVKYLSENLNRRDYFGDLGIDKVY
jgi:hypothetical protein